MRLFSFSDENGRLISIKSLALDNFRVVMKSTSVRIFHAETKVFELFEENSSAITKPKKFLTNQIYNRNRNANV